MTHPWKERKILKPLELQAASRERMLKPKPPTVADLALCHLHANRHAQEGLLFGASPLYRIHL
eukprot:6242493-Pyramimonas_sp.AAC.1